MLPMRGQNEAKEVSFGHNSLTNLVAEATGAVVAPHIAVVF